MTCGFVLHSIFTLQDILLRHLSTLGWEKITRWEIWRVYCVILFGLKTCDSMDGISKEKKWSSTARAKITSVLIQRFFHNERSKSYSSLQEEQATAALDSTMRSFVTWRQQKLEIKSLTEVVNIAGILHWIALDLDSFSCCCVHLHKLWEAIFDQLKAAFVLVYGLSIWLAWIRELIISPKAITMFHRNIKVGANNSLM